MFGQWDKALARLDPGTRARVRVWPLRLRPGDDVSCLNVYQAARPRVLGVSADFSARGGFAFASSLAATPEDKANPWRLLDGPADGDGAIPAIGDYNSVVWLLHSGLGKTVEVGGARLRFVALLKGSVFQGELLIADGHFRRLFPEHSGWRAFAIEAPPGKAEAVGATFEAALEDFGFDATNAARRLDDLMAVENAYLATFQSLGGLGLALGTLGLALAMLRNLIERRGEFALLRAVGYRRGALVWLAVSENGLLLVLGLVPGGACALVAVAPALAPGATGIPWTAHIPWGSVAAILGGVLVFGLAATVLCAMAALRGLGVEALKEE
jgi:ABC-type antimicrobial peptide transport system permease subunit